MKQILVSLATLAQVWGNQTGRMLSNSDTMDMTTSGVGEWVLIPRRYAVDRILTRRVTFAVLVHDAEETDLSQPVE